MNYYSTRDTEKKIAKTAAEVIKQGLADDGGLFLPESIPEISLDFIKEISSLSSAIVNAGRKSYPFER